MDTLRGVIERITYHNEENGYTVAKLLPEKQPRQQFGRNSEVAIVGNMADINVGESVELTGRWTVHAEYGRQFAVETLRSILPATITGIEKYLGSGLIKGVGPVTAKRIVQHFGLHTLTIIDEEAERLNEVPGVGRKRVAMIRAAWDEQRAIKEVMLFLQSHGVSTGLATKIYKRYGDKAITIVQSDPYRLAQDIYGIGFLTADAIARALGIPANAPQRVAAGVAYALNAAADEGHVYLPTAELLDRAAELLDVSPSQVGIGLLHLWQVDGIRVAAAPGGDAIALHELSHPAPPGADLANEDAIPQIVAEAGQLYATATQDQAQALTTTECAIYLPPFFYGEMGVARGLRRICSGGWSALEQAFAHDMDWDAAFAAAEQRRGLRLVPQQRQAVQTALTQRLTVLTGGPGTGKTTTVRTILHCCQRAGCRALLAAPTGRAAKRLAETTGHEAKTLHRLLEFQPAAGTTFKRNAENPLEGDILIVDEASMLDLILMNHVVKAMPPGMHLLLVGDVDQLPSVGAGNVLKDIIAAIEPRADSRSDTRLNTTAMADAAIADQEKSPAPEPDSKSAAVEPAAWQPVHPAAPVPHAIPHAQVVRLQTIFRQEAGSYIITNAHRINQGQMPIFDNANATDFFLFNVADVQRAAQLCVELVQTRIPRRFAIPPADIQVLSPMHRGAVGVGALNGALQAALNPAAANKPERALGNRIFRPGDRVMQIRNNYDKDVYNGDMGTITGLDLALQKLTVNFDGRTIPYDFLELDELMHAFAVSIHKSQGSEFPAVVIPILMTHYMMLQRNLLYTAVTRAKRLVVLVGQPKAIALAVRANQVTTRHTGLRERLSR